MWYNKSNSFFLASPVIRKVIVSNMTNFPTISYEKRIQVKSVMLKYVWVKKKNNNNNNNKKKKKKKKKKTTKKKKKKKKKKKEKNIFYNQKKTCDTDIRLRQFLYEN